MKYVGLPTTYWKIIMKNRNKSAIKELLAIIWGRKKIDARKLLLLLRHDKKIRNEIRSILIENHPQKELERTEGKELIEKPLTEELNFTPEQQLLDILLKDKELAKNWIKDDAPQDRQLVQLIVTGSQWNNILLLWKNLKKRCNEREDKATENELAFLQGCLDLYNLQWKKSEVCFDKPIKGEPYDHETHQRASITPKGENIEEIWLYGLINVDGKLNKQHKSIVVTK